MSKLGVLPLLLLLVPAPASAERLLFDHRLYPPLKAIFDDGRDEMIAHNRSDPKYIVDRIAIIGNSLDDWTEAMDIIARAPSKDVKTKEDWLAEIKSKASAACPSTFETLASDDISITFSRRSTGCATDKVQYALYRIVVGKRTMFLLNPIRRADMSDSVRQQWIELLKSARLEK